MNNLTTYSTDARRHPRAIAAVRPSLAKTAMLASGLVASLISLILSGLL